MTARPPRTSPPADPSRLRITRRSLAAFGLGLLALCPPGCKSPQEWELQADDEVYSIVAERRAELGEENAFSIAVPPDSLRQRVLAGERPPELMSLSLEDCQRFAAENSVGYQDQREALYLAALDLTLTRYGFGTVLDIDGGVSLDGDDAGFDSYSADGGLTFSRVLGNGADVVVDIGGSFFESIASGDPSEFISDLGLSITRPLLAGSSNEAIFDSLTRAERRVVDQARSYERFRRSFAVDVYARYWRILQETEVVLNEINNYDNLKLLRERNEAHGEAGRLADIQVDQATQDELRASSRLIAAKARLEGLYDDFKFFMGLPIDLEIELDQTAFAAFAATGIEVFEIDEEVAIEMALTRRLDLATEADLLLDAERSLRIAEGNLGTRLDLVVSGGASSEVEPGLAFSRANTDWSVALDYDLPVDRLAERNDYREAQIFLQRVQRDLATAQDQVTVTIRDDLRRLEEARADFPIQELSVVLAERRVESSDLKLEAGLAETRDVLEAREDLLSARNARVGALVEYSLARLDLMLDMEMLDVDEQGLRVSASLQELGIGSTDPQGSEIQETLPEVSGTEDQ